MSGDVKPANKVLIYDKSGDHPALQAAEIAGASVEIMTLDRTFSPDVMEMNLVPYIRSLQDKDITFTVTRRLLGVVRSGNTLTATTGTDYSGHTYDVAVDQVVNYGTLPLDALYFDLKPLSYNAGKVDYESLIATQPQIIQRNVSGTYQLSRIGDAVSARNTHEAIYDVLRLVKNI
jgi:hypothetical protein